MQKPIPSQLQTYTLPDLLSGTTVIDWIVEPFLPPGTTNLLAGNSGIGKTWFLLDLAICVALGEKWLGQFNVRQGTVLIVDEENAELLLRQRLRKLLAARGITDASSIPIHFMIGQAVNFSPVNDKQGANLPSLKFDQLLSIVKALSPILTIFDSLTRVHSANENNANEISAMFANVHKLVAETGTTTLFSHHVNKSANGSGHSGDRIRGSSDIRAFCDTTLILEEMSDGSRVVTHDKARWCESESPFTVKFDSAQDTFKLEYDNPVKSKTKMTCGNWLLDLLKQGAKEKQEIIKAGEGNFSARVIEKELRAQQEQGHIEREMQGHKAFFKLSEKPTNSASAENENAPNPLSFLNIVKN